MPRKSLPWVLDPPEGWRQKQAGAIPIKDFYTLLLRIDLRDVDPVLVLRNQAMLWMTWASAFRAKECAMWLVKEALYPSGQLVPMTRIRADGTKGTRPVIAPVVVKEQRQMLNRWLDLRAEKGIMATGEKAYRGLNPESPVFPRWWAGAWGHWAPTRKRTKGKEYLVWTNIQTMISQFYQHHGWKQCSSHSGRRSITEALSQRGGSRRLKQGLLGHVSEDTQDIYSDIDWKVLDAAYSNLYRTKNPTRLRTCFT